MNGGRTHDFQESLNREIVDGILARCVEIYKIYRTKAARPTIPARPVPAGPVGAALPPAGGAVGVLMVLLVKAGGTTLLPPAGTEPVGAAAPLWDIC
jgi:hypothetical protein